MDRIEKSELHVLIRSAIRSAIDEEQEQWLTAKALCNRFGMFTQSWLKRYGHLLPRTQVVVNDNDGVHRSAWAYPAIKINKMILDGTIKNLNNTRQNGI